MAGISMRELAELLEVSVASVSVALRGKPGISSETRARILEEARIRGYDMSRLNAASSKGVIEVLDYTYYSRSATPEEIPYYRQFLDAVTETISRHGYTLSGSFHPTEPGFSSRPSANGSIILGAGISPQELTEYQQRGIPFVIAGNSFSAFPVNTVSHDNFYGIQAGIAHLVSLGHTKIGYVHSLEGIPGQERYQAYRFAIQQKELEYGERVDITMADRRPAAENDCNGSSEINQKRILTGTELSEYWLSRLHAWLEQGLPTATAFLCDSDLTAASLMRALRSHHLIPGRDISVIGFDDQPFAALLEPPLTSVHTYEPELGAAVAEQLIFCLEHPGCRYRHVRLGTELVVRESTQISLQREIE